MSATQRDLKYYLEHTDEMPTDPKELERLAGEHIDAALESGTEQMDINNIVGKADEIPGVAAATNTEAETKTTEPAAKVETETTLAAETSAGETKPEGILAKDGKNIIPYSQLESARQRAAAAETLARQQAEELAALRAAKAAPVENADADMLTEEELQALEAESPTLAKTLRAQQNALTQVRDQLQAVVQSQQQQVENEAEVVKSEIQTAIDANPTLATWQTAEDKTLWNEASRFDKLLRESPKYANVPFSERFAKVVELTQSALGLEVEAPAARQEPTLTPEQIKAAAEAKLKAVSKTSKPVSLSQIPGGAPPVVDERQKVEEMSSVALGQQFLGMTKDQLDAYLATL